MGRWTGSKISGGFLAGDYWGGASIVEDSWSLIDFLGKNEIIERTGSS
jgi:hypothetical protein